MKDIIGKGQRFLQRMKRRIVHAWQTMHAKRHYYTSLLAYASEFPDKAEILSRRVEELVYTIGENTNELQRGEKFEVVKARISHASCFVYSDIIMLEDGRCIYGMKDIDFMRPIADFTDEILLKDTDQWCKQKTCNRVEHISKAIKIGGMFGFNYYHFMFQLLPKMFEIDDIDPSVPLILDKKTEVVPSMKQLLEWCNTAHREVIYMDYDVRYEVDELYIVNSPNVCIPNLKATHVLYEPKAMFSLTSLKQLRESLLKHMDTKSVFPDKIYVCRKQATKLRGYNEDELLAVAQRYGYEAVYPETLNVSQQMALFHQAKHIIAPEGAALSNLVYAGEGSNLIIMYCMRGLSSEFVPIALTNGITVHELWDTPKSKRDTSYQRNYRIEPENLEKVLSEYEKVNY